VCRGAAYSLVELAEMVAAASGCNPEIMVRNPALAPEYSADNTRMLNEIGGFAFRPMSDCVGELYQWYKEHAESIAVEQLKFDDSE
jgi:nucleoside-diphosphate-sugar epimerase